MNKYKLLLLCVLLYIAITIFSLIIARDNGMLPADTTVFINYRLTHVLVGPTVQVAPFFHEVAYFYNYPDQLRSSDKVSVLIEEFVFGFLFWGFGLFLIFLSCAIPKEKCVTPARITFVVYWLVVGLFVNPFFDNLASI